MQADIDNFSHLVFKDQVKSCILIFLLTHIIYNYNNTTMKVTETKSHD